VLLVTLGEELEGGEALDAEFGGDGGVLFLVGVDIGDEALLFVFLLVKGKGKRGGKAPQIRV
jgi:hypothetical protein